MLKNENKQKKIIEAFTFYNKRIQDFINIPAGMKHILVFGQSRQGKSSLVNLMTGKNKFNGAEVSPNVIGCTFTTEPYINNNYCFWDTAGLNEQESGCLTNAESTKNLISFIKDSKGFHAAIMVVSWNNFNSASTKQNWDLFYDVFLDQRVPIIICITGRGIETSDEDQNWINEQKELFDNLGFNGKYPNNGFKCVVYSKDLSEIKNQSMKVIYEELRIRSIEYINTLLERNTSDEFYHPLNDKKWYDVFLKMWNLIMQFINMKNLMITINEAFKNILLKIGFSEKDADEICKETLI